MNDIDKQIEILNDFKRLYEAELARKAREQEERRLWYEKTASELLKKPVVVKWYQDPHGFGGEFRNRPTGHIIQLVPGFSLQIERSCWAHEVGHGLMNHGAGWTQEGQEKADLMHEVWQSPELSKRLGVDVKGLYQTHYRERCDKEECQADLVGEELFHFYWPEDVFVKHNSTELQMQIKFK